MVVDVVGAEGLLDPIGVVILVDAHEAQRRGKVRPRVVGIEHQDDFGTDRIARGGDAGAFLARIGVAADLDLDRLEAELDVAGDLRAELSRRLARQVITAAGIGRHAVGTDGAEEFVERQAGGARVAVPQRDVDDRKRPHDGTGAALEQRLLIHLLPQPLDAMGVLPDQLRREQLARCERYELAAGAARVAETDPLVTVIALDLDDGIMTLGDRSLRERGRHFERNAQGAAANFRDFGHGFLAPKLGAVSFDSPATRAAQDEDRLFQTTPSP